MAQEFNVANVNTRFTTSGLSTVQSGINKLGLSVGKVAGLLGGLGLAFSAKNMATSFFQTTKKLEQMKMAITAVSKTAAEADTTFERIKSWAEVNPVNTDDAIAAFVRMRTAGVQNAEAAMTQIADLASVTSRNMADVASAIVTTEVEPLRNLGIQLDRTGKQAIIQFGEVKKAVSKDINSVRAGIIEVLQQAIPGAMERTKNSVTGSLNTMSGMWQKMQSDIMGWGTQGGGLFGSINQSLNEFRDNWEKWQQSADYQKFINNVSGSLQTMLNLFVDGAQKVGMLVKALYDHKDALITVTAAFAGYKIGMAAMAAITPHLVRQITVMIYRTQSLTAAFTALKAALSGMSAGGFAGLVLGITAAGFAYTELKKRQELARAEAERTDKAMKALDKNFKNASTAKLRSEIATASAELKKMTDAAYASAKAMIEAKLTAQNEAFEGYYSGYGYNVKSQVKYTKKQFEEALKSGKKIDGLSDTDREKILYSAKYIEILKEQEKELTASEQAAKNAGKAIADTTAKATSKGTDKSAAEKLIEQVDVKVRYANASISEQVTLLEQEQTKVKKYSEDWIRLEDKIREYKTILTSTKDASFDLGVEKGTTTAAESFDYYLKKLREFKSDGTVTAISEESQLVSKSTTALTQAVQLITEKFDDQKIPIEDATAALEVFAQAAGITVTQSEIVSNAIKDIAQKQKEIELTRAEEQIELFNKQLETGVITLPQYIELTNKLKDSLIGNAVAINKVTKAQEEAQKSASTYETRMSSIYEQLNKNVVELNSNVPDKFVDGLARAISYGEDLGESMKTLAQDIAFAITKMLIFKALFGDNNGTGGLFGGFFSKMFGGFHSGGIVGTDAPTFTRSLPLPKFHTGGIVGNDEELAILKKGEGVFTKGQMQALGNSINNKTQTQTVTEGGTQIGSMTVNINAIDQQSFASNLANNKAVIEGIIVKNVMSNGNVRRTLKTALA